MNVCEDLYVRAQRKSIGYACFKGRNQIGRTWGCTRSVLIELKLTSLCRDYYNWTGSTYLIHTVVHTYPYRIL